MRLPAETGRSPRIRKNSNEKGIIPHGIHMTLCPVRPSHLILRRHFPYRLPNLLHQFRRRNHLHRPGHLDRPPAHGLPVHNRKAGWRHHYDQALCNCCHVSMATFWQQESKASPVGQALYVPDASVSDPDSVHSFIFCSTAAISGTLAIPPCFCVERLAAVQAKRTIRRSSFSVRSDGFLPY